LEFQSLEKIKLRNHEYPQLGFLKICRILIIPPDSYLNTVVKTPAQRKKERIMHPGASLDIASIQWNYENSKNWILKICLPSLVETA
jgi:hypothetical protein